jgi:hypothetical protein
MDDLVAFVRDRLDEDEAMARSVKPLGHTAALGGIRIEHAFAVTRLVASGEDGSYRSEADRAAAAHFRRHDPARVLREVAAKRRLLARHALVSGGRPSQFSSFQRGQDHGYVEACEDMLRDMAATWSDHPAFRTEWEVVDD